ncbi:hypothetical protein GCM10011505_49370 [Tistrella bauzanensis]|uniref:Uncharacterized protein n=1 Tax=Tistrella bauzanensis TaxID=657419 RepID=A0ABQ1J8S6_9PROT|nr:hypothetical protein GCM10011505_49370 [Tistrella bauzanensis]
MPYMLVTTMPCWPLFSDQAQLARAASISDFTWFGSNARAPASAEGATAAITAEAGGGVGLGIGRGSVARAAVWMGLALLAVAASAAIGDSTPIAAIAQAISPARIGDVTVIKANSGFSTVSTLNGSGGPAWQTQWHASRLPPSPDCRGRPSRSDRLYY